MLINASVNGLIAGCLLEKRTEISKICITNMRRIKFEQQQIQIHSLFLDFHILLSVILVENSCCLTSATARKLLLLVLKEYFVLLPGAVTSKLTSHWNTDFHYIHLVFKLWGGTPSSCISALLVADSLLLPITTLSWAFIMKEPQETVLPDVMHVTKLLTDGGFWLIL